MLFFKRKRSWDFVVTCVLPIKAEYIELPGILKAYWPPTPNMKPVAGLEPIIGRRISEPELSSLFFGGLCNASRIISPISFCLKVVLVFVESES
jgi:hypothetical protein